MDFARYRLPLKLLGKRFLAESYTFDDAHIVAEAASCVFR